MPGLEPRPSSPVPCHSASRSPLRWFQGYRSRSHRMRAILFRVPQSFRIPGFPPGRRSSLVLQTRSALYQNQRGKTNLLRILFILTLQILLILIEGNDGSPHTPSLQKTRIRIGRSRFLWLIRPVTLRFIMSFFKGHKKANGSIITYFPIGAAHCSTLFLKTFPISLEQLVFHIENGLFARDRNDAFHRCAARSRRIVKGSTSARLIATSLT